MNNQDDKFPPLVSKWTTLVGLSTLDPSLVIVSGFENSKKSNHHQPKFLYALVVPKFFSLPRSVPSMSTGRSSLAAVSINVSGAGPSLVVTGGRGLNSCESFELTRWRWRQGPSMALGRESDLAKTHSQGKETVPKSKQKFRNWWSEQERDSFMWAFFSWFLLLYGDESIFRFPFMKRDWKPMFRSL